ncbi:Z-ring formation inhibitor MciZ [Bacillus mangrovi]|uniref:Z-ring formation inhibitor MciZ n=1 Tax=Metabacillus mangrovi TaxID=1491830 RepID=A0A7X2S2C4_9BACI|nr:Z-ring formation inhibitor MciZ [Metabacillus mangrovi]MTH52265.1 Z-ring formation inhibitor MciZ [Metabacillus mangrovi]
MKIYKLEKGIILTGKAWEIRMKLKEYGKKYKTVKEWIDHS